MLNDIQNRRRYRGFYIVRSGPQVNHLAFANDIILFISGHKNTLRLVMDTLTSYEENYGQKINKNKSYFMLQPGASSRAINRVINIIRMH